MDLTDASVGSNVGGGGDAAQLISPSLDGSGGDPGTPSERGELATRFNGRGTGGYWLLLQTLGVTGGWGVGGRTRGEGELAKGREGRDRSAATHAKGPWKSWVAVESRVIVIAIGQDGRGGTEARWPLSCFPGWLTSVVVRQQKRETRCCFGAADVGVMASRRVVFA